MRYERLILIFVFFISCNSEKDGTENSSESEVLNNIKYDISAILDKFETREGFSYSLNNNNITFNTDNLPNHTSPYWPTSSNLYEEYNGSNSNFRINPNKIEAQNITISVPMNPSESVIKLATSLGAIGVARNGVVFYNQYAGPNNQPLTNEINSFDQWLGHPTGRKCISLSHRTFVSNAAIRKDSFWVYWLMVFLCMDQLKMEKKSQIIILILITVIHT